MQSIIDAIEIIFTPATIKYLWSGLLTTLIISLVTVLLSLLLGAILGICRNYGNIVLKKAASFYIEIFRNTPLLLWMLVCITMVKTGSYLQRGTLALILYTSSVVAEIVRGGLNSIHFGQWEAAKSQGFNFVQTLFFIVMPQCFMRIVPSLVSQIITTVKDTSFLAQFAISEFFWNSRQVLALVGRVTVISSTHVFILLTFNALVYFIINFTLSILSRKIKNRST